MPPQQQQASLEFQNDYNSQSNEQKLKLFLENKTQVTHEIQEIDEQIIHLLSRRFKLSEGLFTAQEFVEFMQNSELESIIDRHSKKNEAAVSSKKKKNSKKQDPNKEEKEYQLGLIHRAKKFQIRRTLIRKIFRSIQQEVTYLKKQHNKRLKS